MLPSKALTCCTLMTCSFTTQKATSEQQYAPWLKAKTLETKSNFEFDWLSTRFSPKV